MKDYQPGKVTLIGAGPGDPELLTLKALRAIERADVAVFDRLVGQEVLDLIPTSTMRIDVGKAPGCHTLPQDQINTLLVKLAREGRQVARIKGGDPMIFGRGGEEAAALRAAGIQVSCIPGITAAQGAAAAACLPLTQRGLATSLQYVTGHRAADAALDLNWESLAREDTTLAVYMGTASIGQMTAELVAHGLPSYLPVLAIASATTPAERRLLSTLGQISQDVARAGLSAPVLFLIGHVVSLYPGVVPSGILSGAVAAHA